MKKWSIIVGVVMAVLLLAMGSMSALAQTDEDVTVSQNPTIRDGLAIVAPRVAPVDTEISMTVFKCSNQEPVEGASVWLVTRDKLETLRQEMARFKGKNGPNTEQEDYESLLSIHGTLLGQTDEEGKVWHSFDNAGRYLLGSQRPREHHRSHELRRHHLNDRGALCQIQFLYHPDAIPDFLPSDEYHIQYPPFFIVFCNLLKSSSNYPLILVFSFLAT